jgi:hypothetical protein
VPYELVLPPNEHVAGWRVKIRDKERLEPPHVTVLFRGRVVGRWDLRSEQFLLPPECSWASMPTSMRDAILANRVELARQWDRMYPFNLVHGAGDDD